MQKNNKINHLFHLLFNFFEKFSSFIIEISYFHLLTITNIFDSKSCED